MTEEKNDSVNDINTCDKEPVSFIASIQAHAAMFCFSRSDYRIHNYSENIAKLFGSSEVLHKRLGEFNFGKAIVDRFESLIKNDKWEILNESYFKEEFEGQIFEVHLFSIEGLICCEVECLNWFSIEDDIHNNPQLGLSHFYTFTKFKATTDISALGKELCTQIRNLTGLERVMLYQFSPTDWHGTVIAEDKTASAHSFLGHTFPASDIPKPARDLYLKNKVRYIADSSATSSPIIPVENSATQAIIDLSSSKTRAVSPIHLEYLKNMGVKTSYSVAVVVNNELWGLVACHSTKLLFINQDMRLYSENLSEAFSIAIPLIESNQKLNNEVNFSDTLLKVTLQINNIREPIKELFKNNANIFKLFNCDGMAIINGTDISLAGFTPPKNDLAKIARELKSLAENAQANVFSTDSLSDINNEWSSFSEIASGALAFFINQNFLIFFRKELVSTIVWGGDPRKLEKRNYQGRINPRKSFQSWEEILKNKSKAWQPFEIEGATKFKKLINEVTGPLHFKI